LIGIIRIFSFPLPCKENSLSGSVASEKRVIWGLMQLVQLRRAATREATMEVRIKTVLAIYPSR
jgi:hypothetical protein